MLVMFLCMIVGFLANKLKLAPDNTATVLSKLENYFFVPALIINTFMKYCTVSSVTEQYKLILYCLAALVIALAVALPLSKVFSGGDSYKRNIYKYALAFGNFSFMGNAIVPAIMGDGLVVSCDKIRGGKKLYDKFMQMYKDKGHILTGKDIYIDHSLTDEKLSEFTEAAEDAFNPSSIKTVELGATIGSHAGPGLSAVIYIKD